MIRLLASLGLAGLVGAGFVWALGLHGTIVLSVGGHETILSASNAIGIATAFAFACMIAGHLLWLALTSSGVLGPRLNRLRRRRGQTALSQGLLAAAAGDARTAAAHAEDARVYLGDQSLYLLLAAQVARLEGDDEAQASAWQAMLSRPDTAALGLRGLYVLAMRRGELEIAGALVLRALERDARTPWAANALFDLATRRRQWADAKSALAGLRRAKLVDHTSAIRLESVLLTAQAHDAEKRGEVDAALATALAALSLSRGFAPAVAIAARVLMQSGRTWLAQDVLADAWTANPHPHLAQLFAAIAAGEPSDRRANRMRALARLNRDHFESRLLLARQAMILSDCTEARRVLSPVAQGHTSSRLCSIMAEIEHFDGRDAWAAYAWSSSSPRAEQDSHWRCARCGAASAEWEAVCGNCGTFDTLRWPSSEKLKRAKHRDRGGEHVAIDQMPLEPSRGRSYELRNFGSGGRGRLLGKPKTFAAMPPADDIGPGNFGFDRTPGT